MGAAQAPSTAGLEVVEGEEVEEKQPLALQNWRPIQVLFWEFGSVDAGLRVRRQSAIISESSAHSVERYW